MSLSLAVFAGFVAWALPVHGQPLAYYADLWPLLPLFLLGYAQAGLYPGTGLGPVETLRRLTYVTSVTFLFAAGLSFALQLPYLYSRVTFLLAFVLALVLVPAVRLGLLALVARTSWWPEPVVVVAAERSGADRIVEGLRRMPRLGYAPSGVLWMAAEGGSAEARRVADLPEWRDAAEARSESGAAVALVAAGSQRDDEAFDRLQRCFHRVLLIRGFEGLPVEGIRVHNLGDFLAFEYTNNLLDPRNRAIKRALDLIVGSFALVISLPLLALAILAVELRSRGPFFFVQSRAGVGGQRIRVPKIRTMVPRAERQLEEAMSRDPGLRRQWSERMKLRDDPRLIPGVGRFLRRFSIDELPQLWSVVKGDMSLVGPRPFPDYHLEQFSPRFHELRQRVRPGLTGLWQVTVRSEGTLEQQESLDSYYIRNWSLWLDLYLLARTAGAVIGGRGAY